VLQDYSGVFLDYLLLIDTACTIMVYSEATFSAPLASRMRYPFLVLTIPLVVFALFRYLYLVVQRGQGGEPADLLLKDRGMQAAIGLWAMIVLAVQVFQLDQV
jgi:4-hydroxybenzoate polyprenyltransferase